MRYKEFFIGEKKIDTIIYKGARYFPLNKLGKDIFLRKSHKQIITSQNRERYKRHLKLLPVKYNGSFSDTAHISEQGLKKLIKSFRLRNTTEEQRVLLNKLREKIGMVGIPIDIEDKTGYKSKWLSELDTYTRDVVETELEKMNTPSRVRVRLCGLCMNHLPLTNRFFATDRKGAKGYTGTCRVCSGRNKHFTHQLSEKRLVKNAGVYNEYIEGEIFKVYESYVQGNLKNLPSSYRNKKTYKEIILYLYEKGRIDLSLLNQNYLANQHKLKFIEQFFKHHEIFSLLFGEEFYLKAWIYPKFQFRDIVIDYKIANHNIKSFIDAHNIVIDNIFSYNYSKILDKTRMRKFIERGGQLYFWVQYYNFKYPGYKFNHVSEKYYKNVENILFDLKYLIEQDLKIDILKIPLYLTRSILYKKCPPLYNVLVKGKEISIYEAVDKIYPNKFTIQDFEINPYRNEFDSDEEMWIHELLKEEFGNSVIYNQRESIGLCLKGKSPDWLIFTDSGVWIVEYFGLLLGSGEGSGRNRDYKERYIDKKNKYSELSGYNFLYLYRDDIADNFQGVKSKIEKLKEKSIVVDV